MLPIEEIFKNWLFCKNKNILFVTKYFWYKLIRLEGTVTNAQLGWGGGGGEAGGPSALF